MHERRETGSEKRRESGSEKRIESGNEKGRETGNENRRETECDANEDKRKLLGRCFEDVCNITQKNRLAQ